MPQAKADWPAWSRSRPCHDIQENLEDFEDLVEHVVDGSDELLEHDIAVICARRPATVRVRPR
jgi:hypothetical protein